MSVDGCWLSRVVGWWRSSDPEPTLSLNVEPECTGILSN